MRYIFAWFLLTFLWSCSSEEVTPPVVNDPPSFETALNFNPLGYTPLSATYQISGKENGSIRMTIKHIDGNGEDFVKLFDKESEEFSMSIFGLYFNHNNTVIIDFIQDQKVTNVDTLKIQTSEQPGYLPEIEVTVLKLDQMEPGMNFINFRGSDPTNPFFVDHEGHVRYLLDFTTHPDLSLLNYDVGPERLKNGNWVFGAWPSNKIYETSMFGEVMNKWTIPGHSFHHTVHEKADGNLLVSTTKYGSEHITGREAIEDFVVEMKRGAGSTIVQEWDLKESIDQLRNAQGTSMSDTRIDWAHVNAMVDDPRDSSIIVSCRFQGLIKLNNDNEVIWILNNHKGWGLNASGIDLNNKLLTPLTADGNIITDQMMLDGDINHPDFEWPWFQHAPLIDQDGNIFLFDNGDKRNFKTDTKYSRAVGYKVDETNMTVQQIWTYGKDRGIACYSSIASDVDIEPLTGNVLFCPGSRVQNLNGFGGKIVELDFDSKEPVFEMELNGNGILFHRADRLPLYHE